MHWRTANCPVAGQICLMANLLLTEPLGHAHIKPRLLGHWCTSPGLDRQECLSLLSAVPVGRIVYMRQALPAVARGVQC